MPIEKKFKILRRTWKVAGLGSTKLEKGIIPINGAKFKDVQKVMRVKGYIRDMQWMMGRDILIILSEI